MRRLATPLIVLLALAVQPICVSAGTISDLVVFGDSLSDAGNAYQASGNIDPAPPYWEGRFSNGPVWVSRYSYLIGVTDPVRSLAGGTNYAYGGAETGFGTSWKNTPNIGEQIHTYLDVDAGTFSSTTQVILWGGANDIFSAVAAFEDASAAVTSAVANLGQHIETLAGGGATQFLVPNLPPLGSTPIGNELPAFLPDLNLLSEQFNAGLSTELDRLRLSLPVTITGIDTYGMISDAIANPSAYGLTNVVDRAKDEPLGTDISGYLFWDDVHPTTYGHQILADAIAIPEPGPITLLLSAGLMLVLASLGSSLRLGERKGTFCSSPKK